MKINHDFHIHTDLSICADETATFENYLEIAKKMGLSKIGFANHFWDKSVEKPFEFYTIQDFEHISALLPKIEEAKSSGMSVYFGAEAEYAPHIGDVAISEETAEKLEFLLVPNSHTHITMPKEYYEPYEKHIDFMIKAYEDIINSKVAKYITAIAHPFCAVCCPYDREILINQISDDTFKRLFDKTANKGIAFELNTSYMKAFKKSEEEIAGAAHIRMYRLAKECGCKFIFGSDAHDNKEHDSYRKISDIFVKLLDIKEDDILEFAK